jgi:hypothetical protein
MSTLPRLGLDGVTGCRADQTSGHLPLPPFLMHTNNGLVSVIDSAVSQRA